MTTITSERADERQTKATEATEKIEGERVTLLARKHEASDSVERLHDEILTAERAGADPQTLATLRRDRTEKEQVSADLDRVLSLVEQDLIPARAEKRAATIAIHAEKYNTLVTRQCDLTEVMSQAVNTLAESLASKLKLAQQQDAIQSEVECPNTELSPASMRQALISTLIEELQTERKHSPRGLHRIDWTCRPMAEGGNLLPLE